MSELPPLDLLIDVQYSTPSHYEGLVTYARLHLFK